jgi:HKD family nuclease
MGSMTVIVSLVSNDTGNGHGGAIDAVLADAEAISIAVAFFKVGGAQFIGPLLETRLADGANVEIFVGTDFFLTEPDALKILLALRKRHPGLTVFLGDRGKATFHPKIYAARVGASCRSLVGSANLTAGALSDNDEVSVRTDHADGDALSLQLAKQFDRFRADPRFHALDDFILLRYEERYRLHKRLRDRLEKEMKDQLVDGLELGLVANLFAQYQQDPRAAKQRRERKRKRRAALVVQRAIASLPAGSLGRSDTGTFQGHLRDLMTSNGGRHLWGSNNIFRRGSVALDQPRQVVSLFKLAARVAHLPPAQAYAQVRGPAKAIAGVGLNMVTEILCSFAPQRYAVYNGNTAGALAALGIPNPYASNLASITPERYAQLCVLIGALGEHLGGVDLSEADAFLNWVYEWSKEQGAIG